MNLLSLPSVNSKLEEIERSFGPKSLNTSGSAEPDTLDLFFWLRARERNEEGKPRFRFLSTVHSPEPIATEDFRVCNLVLQGGGTLGLAHAGFIAGLERAGIRFLGLAGTSAGSIIAMGIAAIRGSDLSKETHSKLAELSSSAPMDTFIDGPRPIRVFIKSVLKRVGFYSPEFVWAALASIRRLRDRRGLNYGDAFETWFQEVMEELDFASIEELSDALDTIWNDVSDLTTEHGIDNASPEKLLISDRSNDPGYQLLQLITTAMPVGLKFNLPEDLIHLAPEYRQSSPSSLVRTSMSIPGFFEPVVMRTNQESWPSFANRSLGRLLPKNKREYFADLDELTFLDGGLLSNLPSDSFRKLMPNVPTVVVPLYGDQKLTEVTGRRSFADLASDVTACISAVRLQRDREVWLQNFELKREYEAKEALMADEEKRQNTRLYPTEMADVNTGDKDWLNFVMSDQDKLELFETGLDSARAFLMNIGKEKGNESYG